MSVCTSANLFSSRRRKVSPPSRRPLADNERWAALNKSIFQDILNAILFQTTFTSGASATGKPQHRHFRPEVGHRSAPPLPPPPAPSLTGSGDHVTPSDCKEEEEEEEEDVGLLQSFERGLDQENSDPDGGRTRPRSSSAVDGKPGIESTSRDAAGATEASKTTSRRKDTADVSDALCPYRRTRPDSRQGHSVAFQGYCGLAPSYGVYCEALLANHLPIMIIGLRPYGTNEKEEEEEEKQKDRGLAETLDSPRGANKREGPQSPECSISDPYVTMDGRCSKDFDGSTKILSGVKIDRTPLTTQLQPVPPNNNYNNNDDRQQQQQQQQQLKALSSSSPPYHHHRLHHHHRRHHSDMPSSCLTRNLSENQQDADKTGGTRRRGGGGDGGGGGGRGSKSSRDHSILTILGLLATDDDDDYGDREGEKRMTRKAASTIEPSRPESSGLGGGGDKKRLVGIGVTVTGASRWMAVDKDIVYDMIDQVLNAEHDLLAGGDSTAAAPSAAGARPFGHPRPGDGNRHTGNRSGSSSWSEPRIGETTAAATARCKGATFLSAHRTQRKETRGSGGGGGGGDLMPKHDTWSRAQTLLRWKPNSSAHHQSPVKRAPSSDVSYDPSRSTAPPKTAARGTRHSSPDDGLEGMSVLRSLLNDDPEDDVISGCGSAHGPTPEVAAAVASSAPPSLGDEIPAGDHTEAAATAADRLPVKRSRQPLAEGRKKRRTNTATLEPSSSSSSSSAADLGGSCPLTSRASPTVLSIKWKSSMLMRMRTAEEEEEAANENEAVATALHGNGTQ